MTQKKNAQKTVITYVSLKLKKTHIKECFKNPQKYKI